MTTQKNNAINSTDRQTLGETGTAESRKRKIRNEEQKPNFDLLFYATSHALGEHIDGELFDGEAAVQLLRALLATGQLLEFATNPAQAEDYLSRVFQEMQ